MCQWARFPSCALAEPQLQPGPPLAGRAGCWQVLQWGTGSGSISKLFAGLGPVSATAVTSQRLELHYALLLEILEGSLNHKFAVCWPWHGNPASAQQPVSLT